MNTLPRIRRIGLLALLVAFQSAVAADGASSPPPAGNGAADGQSVGILSGGVGQDSQDEMRRSAKSFNVHVLFATQQGAYLADVPFTVTDQRGKQVAAAVSDGPWLYLRLPPGNYQLSAKSHGASQSRQLKVAAGAAPISVTLLFPDQ